MNKVVMLILVCIVFFSFSPVVYGDGKETQIWEFAPLSPGTADVFSTSTPTTVRSSVRFSGQEFAPTSNPNIYKFTYDENGDSRDFFIYSARGRSFPLGPDFRLGDEVILGSTGFAIKKTNDMIFATLVEGDYAEILANELKFKQEGSLVVEHVPGIPVSSPVFDLSVLDNPSSVKVNDRGQLQQRMDDGEWDTVNPVNGAFTIGTGDNQVTVRQQDGVTTASKGTSIVSAVVGGDVIRINPPDDGSDSTLTVGGRTFTAHDTPNSAENIKTFHQNYQNLQALERAGLPPGVRITEGLSVKSDGEIIGNNIRPRSFDGEYTVSITGDVQSISRSESQGLPKSTTEISDGAITTTLEPHRSTGGNTVEIKREGDTITTTVTDKDSSSSSITREESTNSQGQTVQRITKVNGQKVFVSTGLFGGQKVEAIVSSNIDGVAFVTSSGKLLNANREEIRGAERREILKDADNRNLIDQLKGQAKEAEEKDNIKEEFNTASSGEAISAIDKRRAQFQIATVPGRIFDGVFQAVGAVRETYGISALFIGKEEQQRRLAEERREMEGLYMRNIFESAFCEDVRESPLIQSQGVAFARMDDGTHKIAVSIQARKQPLVTPDGQEFLYTVTYQIRNDVQKNSPFAETWRYNVWLDGDVSVRLWTMSRSVPPGGIELYTNRNQIVFYSERDYHTLCIEFDYHYAAIETTSVCNRVVTVNEEATPFLMPTTDSQGRQRADTPGASTKPELNLNDL